MALSKDILGLALYERAQALNDKPPDEIGDLEQARKDFWEAIADEVISHFKTFAVIHVTTAGTATAQSGFGTIQS